MEHKQTEPIILNTDDNLGIVEAIWAVMGNVDGGNDIIHPGAFVKTFRERSQQVKLLDNHRTDSIMSALGNVLELRELSRIELPSTLMQKYPEATGAAWGRFQFLLDTPEGKGAFTRIKQNVVQGWSFGYDPIQRDHGNVEKDGRKVSVRNLREIKLWEVSPVLFAMNEATATTDVKAASEGKPYVVVEEEGQYCVYRADSEGQPTGKPMGKHPTRGEANEQVSALYANEDKAGRVYSGRNLEKLRAAYLALGEALGGFMEPDEEEEEKSYTTGPQQSEEAPTSDAKEAGPQLEESTRIKSLIEFELEKMKLLEV